jgi:hypothetical protein
MRLLIAVLLLICMMALFMWAVYFAAFWIGRLA